MRLSARVLLNYIDVNHFSCGNQWIVGAGNPAVIYFQLIDLDQASTSCAPGGLRYMAASGAQPVTITVTFPTNAASLNTFNNDTNGGFVPFGATLTFPTLNPSMVFTTTAAQASPYDSSIYSITLAPTQVPNSGNVMFSITQGTQTSRFTVNNMISVTQLNSGGC